MKWLTAWQLIRDILVTGAGLLLIVSQVFARQPSDVLLAAGLALTAPSVASHVRALLPGSSGTGDGQQQSSSPARAPGAPPSPSSSSPEASGES